MLSMIYDTLYASYPKQEQVPEDPMEDISVCVPVYNCAPFIEATLESILAQDRRGFRVLVQDNASTDGTADIVRGMAARDGRIELRVNPTNLGYCANIRTVVERADTDVVAVFHGDDLYLPGLLDAEYRALKESGSAAAFSSYRQFFGNPGKTAAYPVGPDFGPGAAWYAAGLDGYLPVLMSCGNPFACPTLLTYRSILLGLGSFTDRYPSNEDLDLWIKYLKAGHKLAIVKDRLFLYRRSAGQGSAYWDRRDELPVYFDLLDREVVPGSDVDPGLMEGYRRLKAKAFLTAALNARRAGKREKAAAFMEASRELRRMRPTDGAWFIFQNSLGAFAAYKRLKDLAKRLMAR